MLPRLITVILVYLFLVFTSLFITPAFAQTDFIPPQPPQEERLEGIITSIPEEKQITVFDKNQLYQKIEINITDGSLKGQTVTVENGKLPAANVPHYQNGDKVVLSMNKDPEGKDFFIITDYVRRDSLLWLLAIFTVITILVGRTKGFSSILGMGISFLVIFTFILPKILDGGDPVLITILGSLLIIPVTFYLSHGFNKKTGVAILGTLIALVITGVLANFFVEAGKLSGFVSEEAGFLQAMTVTPINIKGLLLAGIIIGLLGVLDDVTVSQAAVVQQLKEANNKLSAGQLYRRAMAVGRDHIASMVNTLVLVYAGASMPLMLLFINNPHPFSEVINYEIIANEIIRTLVGSIGLILAVPITTIIAALLEKTD